MSTSVKYHYNPCSTTWIRQVPRRPSLAKIDYTVMRQVPLSTTLDDYKNVYHYRRPSKTPWTPNIYEMNVYNYRRPVNDYLHYGP